MHKILVLLLLWGLPNIGISQNQVFKKNLAIDFGWQKVSLKDINYAPFRYQGTGSRIGVSYQKTTKKRSIFQIQTAYSSATIQSDFSTYTSAQKLDFHLQAAYLFSLNKSSNKIQYHLGGSIKTHINYLNYDEFEALTYFNLHTIDLATRIQYSLSNKSTITGTFSLPLFGISVRPPHTGWDHTINETPPLTLIYKGDIETIGNFIALTTKWTYSHQLSNKLALQLHALYNFQHTKKTNSFSSSAIQLALGVNFKL